MPKSLKTFANIVFLLLLQIGVCHDIAFAVFVFVFCHDATQTVAFDLRIIPLIFKRQEHKITHFTAMNIPPTIPAIPTIPAVPTTQVFCIDIGICNIGWCVLESTEPHHVDTIKFVDGGLGWLFDKASRKSCRMIAEKFAHWMHTGPLQRFPNATVVCEEQVPRAAKNKMMSMILLSHCVRSRPFHFVGSNAKFTGMPATLFPPTVNQEEIIHDTYPVRKEASVLLAKHICSSRDLLKPALAIFRELDKQDDFADALNEGFHFFLATPKQKRKAKTPKAKAKTPKAKAKKIIVVVDDSDSDVTPIKSASAKKRKTTNTPAKSASAKKRKTTNTADNCAQLIL